MASGSWENGCDEDLDRMDVPEIDGALLMELLDESQPEEQAADTAGLAGAVGGGAVMAAESNSIHAHEDCEDCGLDGIMSDLDSHDCSGSPTYLLEDPFEWVVETELAAEYSSPSSSDDMSCHWYVDDCMDHGGMAGYGDLRGYSSFYSNGESFMEQVYSPLWG